MISEMLFSTESFSTIAARVRCLSCVFPDDAKAQRLDATNVYGN